MSVYINPVSVSDNKKEYEQPLLHTPEALTKALKEKGIDIVLGNSLKGGVVSQVYEGIYEGKKVVVKHTEDLIPFDPTEIFISKKGHNIDTQILKFLEGKVNVPKVVVTLPDITTTIMEDVREKGFVLQSESIINNELLLDSAGKIGNTIANIALVMRDYKIDNVETAEESIYERGLELRLAYPNTQEQYIELEKEFLSNNQYICCPDIHPKNVFVNDQGESFFIDFGRSVYADQRFMLPNYLAHIVIYTLAGYLNYDIAIEFLNNAVMGYRQLSIIDENIFCKYLGMEVLHRSNGKWIQGINDSDQKSKLLRFGLEVFDKDVSKIDDLVLLIR